MDSLSYKTISANASTVTKEWVVIDAADEVLGRLASQIAKILRGKNKPSYTPHVDCGDYVIVINADKVKLTGKKMTDKVYTRHTGYPAFRYACRLSGQETDVHRRKSSQGHAAPHPSGRRAAQKPEGICRHGASARSAEPEDH
mgnify:CR=1 FL=1